MTTKKKPAKKENIPANKWPKVTEGSHLKVIEHENGRRELQWNDEALMRDVREAIASVEGRSQVKKSKKVKS
jgi:hypothetical protein